jgi:Family of unknown function (DUF6544)
VGKALLLWAPLSLLAVAAVALAAVHWRDARAAAAVERGLVRRPAEAPFDPRVLNDLPEPARRYLAATLAAGTPPARSVRLRMQGRFLLGDAWRPLTATERLAADGLVWRATVMAAGLKVRVYDSLGPGGAAMRAWGLGLVPVARADGPDITRSGAGRLAAELIWLPSALLPGPDVAWEALDADTARFHVTVAGNPLAVDVGVDAAGRPVTVSMARWGDPGADGVFREARFGAELSDHRTFDGYTIPTKIRVGWHFGTAHFTPFMEAEVTEADFSGESE